MITTFNTVPVLTTQRLILRQIDSSADADVRSIFSIRSNDEINEHIGRKKCESLDDAKAFIQKINSLISEGNSCYWGVSLKENNAVIGTVLIWNINREEETAEIGYELLPEYWGQGLMKEAVKCLIDFAFAEVKLKAVDGYIIKSNERSLKLLEKFNFQFYREEEENAVTVRLNNPTV